MRAIFVFYYWYLVALATVYIYARLPHSASIKASYRL